MKKLFCLSIMLVTLISTSFPALAAEKESKDVNPNQIISTQEDIKIPQNVLSANSSITNSTLAVSVTYDTDSGIDWDKGYRSVWGSCQAKQGTVKLDSYSRARFETLIGGLPYLDSGRVWSTNQGTSFAQSGWELYDALNSGVAHTYYGIGV